jgi:hypothetical protein
MAVGAVLGHADGGVQQASSWRVRYTHGATRSALPHSDGDGEQDGA